MKKSIIESPKVLELYKYELANTMDPNLIHVPPNNKNYLILYFHEQTPEGDKKGIVLQVEDSSSATFKVTYGDNDAKVEWVFADKQASLWNDTLEKKRDLENKERYQRAQEHLQYIHKHLKSNK